MDRWLAPPPPWSARAGRFGQLACLHSDKAVMSSTAASFTLILDNATYGAIVLDEEVLLCVLVASFFYAFLLRRARSFVGGF